MGRGEEVRTGQAAGGGGTGGPLPARVGRTEQSVVPDSPSDPGQEAGAEVFMRRKLAAQLLESHLVRAARGLRRAQQGCLAPRSLGLGPVSVSPEAPETSPWAMGSHTALLDGRRDQAGHNSNMSSGPGLVIPPLSSPVCAPAIRGAGPSLGEEVERAPVQRSRGDWTETRTGS